MSTVRWNLKEAGGKVPTRGTRTLSGISDRMSLQNKTKSKKLHGDRSVNDAGTWNEGYLSYHGRSHRRDETKYESRLEKIYCEKSAEIIVPDATTASGKDRTLRSESH